jgi:putative chitinase
VQITDDQLHLISPVIPVGTSGDLNSILGLISASTVQRAALCIGQFCIESDYFRVMTEDPASYSGRSYVPYFGRDWIQLTWQTNYQACGDAIGVDLVSNPDVALQHNPEVCSWFWNSHNLNRFADANDCDGCTRAINGPKADSASLTLRAKYYNRALNVLNGVTDPNFVDVVGGSSSV